MIKDIPEFIKRVKIDFSKWPPKTKPWFRGESSDDPPLHPKIASIAPFEPNKENHLLQSFRRQAGGLANVPDREHTDMWLFLAQHYGVPTRLLDWTEGALMALYFAINKKDIKEPKVFMLNPRKLNEFAGVETNELNYPLSWAYTHASLYVALAWQNRDISKIRKSMERERKAQINKTSDEIDRVLKLLDLHQLEIPVAFPAVYQDPRMISQRSCFTIHGANLDPLTQILHDKGKNLSECLFEYKIDIKEKNNLLTDLSILGISAATIFPDLDHLAEDLRFESL